MEAQQQVFVVNGQLKTKEELNAHFRPEKKSLWSRIKQHKLIYLMLLPCLIHYFVFSYIPMGGLALAFREFRFDSGIFGTGFVGLKYFKEFFRDPRSSLYIRNTLIISFLKLILYLPFPIILAIMFNEVKNDRLRDTTQSIAYLPNFLSWVIVVGLMNALLAPNTGLVNQLKGKLGGDPTTFYMMEKEYFYPIVFLSYLWKQVGWSSIMYYSAIVGISPSLYEAAAIDGANRLQQIRHVLIPGIKPTIVILFILSLDGILSAGFDQIYLLQNPGNADVSQTIDTYVVQVGLQGGQFGYATAIGLMQGVLGLIITVIVNTYARKKQDISLW